MKLEQQVVSLELSKKLKELGVKQDSFFAWEISFGEGRLIWEDYHKHPYTDTADVRQYFSAFTVAELGEMLKNHTHKIIWDRTFEEWFVHLDFKTPNLTEKTEANARAKMLIYLLENNLIEL